MEKSEARTLVGCCGLYCGLCNKYQSQAPSRCIGCKLGEQHSWCSIWNCCVKKHEFETCDECEGVFQCDIFQRRKVAEWIPAAENLRRIEAVGLHEWLDEQMERQALVEFLIENYNEGRSMSFYCRVCSRMDIDLISRAIRETKRKLKMEDRVGMDIKSKARICKSVFREIALGAHIDLSNE